MLRGVPHQYGMEELGVETFQRLFDVLPRPGKCAYRVRKVAPPPEEIERHPPGQALSHLHRERFAHHAVEAVIAHVL